MRKERQKGRMVRTKKEEFKKEREKGRKQIWQKEEMR